MNRRSSEFLLYQTEDGQTRVEVRFDGETVWLTQAALAALGDPVELPELSADGATIRKS